MLFAKKTAQLTPVQAAAAMSEGRLTIIDVRSDAERAETHVPGTVHIPLDELSNRLSELPQGEVAFLCRSGARSQRAVKLAARHGIAVANVRGGLVAWHNDGLATTSPRDRPAA